MPAPKRSANGTWTLFRLYLDEYKSDPTKAARSIAKVESTFNNRLWKLPRTLLRDVEPKQMSLRVTAEPIWSICLFYRLPETFLISRFSCIDNKGEADILRA